MSNTTSLDIYLPERIRAQIVQRYLSRINHKARMNQVVHDPNFYSNPHAYPPFFADHGVVHHLDVARRILEVLETVQGLLIPAREENRLEFMKGYGVILACIHDIGMADFSTLGRAVHPQVASQTLFSLEFDDLLEMIWLENCGNLAWRLTQLAVSGALEQEPKMVLREILAMANCHSKTSVPVAALNDARELRRLMQMYLATPLHQLHYLRQIEITREEILAAQLAQDRAALERGVKALDELQDNFAQERLTADERSGGPQTRFDDYADFQRDSYRWLVSEHPEVQLLAMDVVDTLRALRAADALRQRGTVLKTSGGYEIFVDQQSAKAIMGLRFGEEELYLLEIGDPLSAGEANIAASQLDINGNLRISFHRGTFVDTKASRAAVSHAALAVHDIQADVIESFIRPESALDDNHEPLKRAFEMEILLESPDDDLEFANHVRDALGQYDARLIDRTRCVPSLQNAAASEVERYLKAEDVDWNLPARMKLLHQLAKAGHKTATIDPLAAFNNVKLIELKKGEDLVEAGNPSNFVYIPLDQGLRVIPLGGYASFPVQAWMPLGVTGVIRGAARNATIIAEQPLTLLMIPKSVYLQYWHRTYTVAEFAALFQDRLTASQEKTKGSSSQSDEPKEADDRGSRG